METTPALLTIKYAPFFIQTASIKAVKPLYSNEVFGITWDIDLLLLLEVRKQNGSTYDYQLNIRGNFRKDSSGRIIGWGSNFKIQKLFNNLSAVGVINSDGSIDEKSLQQLIGKDIFVLNYISGTREDGRLKYQMYDAVALDRTTLLADFNKSVDSGYPRNYNPRVLLDEYTASSNNSSSNSNNDSQHSDDEDEFVF